MFPFDLVQVTGTLNAFVVDIGSEFIAYLGSCMHVWMTLSGALNNRLTSQAQIVSATVRCN